MDHAVRGSHFAARFSNRLRRSRQAQRVRLRQRAVMQNNFPAFGKGFGLEQVNAPRRNCKCSRSPVCKYKIPPPLIASGVTCPTETPKLVPSTVRQ